MTEDRDWTSYTSIGDFIEVGIRDGLVTLAIPSTVSMSPTIARALAEALLARVDALEGK